MKKTFTTGIIAGFLGGLFLIISTAAGTAAAISYITLDGDITITHKVGYSPGTLQLEVDHTGSISE